MEIRNTADDVVDDDDEVIFYIEACVSNDGTLLTNQVNLRACAYTLCMGIPYFTIDCLQGINLRSEDMNTGNSDSIDFLLGHPTLEVNKTRLCLSCYLTF